MKKLNKLFAILFAVLGVTTLKAQTDVTSLYLTNADFSSTTGWTAYVSNQFKDYGNGKIGGKLASYAASSTDATHLNSEYFFGFQCRWSSSYASYNQETSELPAGVYTLSYDVQNRNGSTTAASYNNLFYVKVGEKTYTDSYTEWMTGSTGWTSHSITFTITSASKATISLGYGTGANNFQTTNTPVLYVSHLKLEYTSFDDALESGWTAPQVPGTDIASLVGTGVNVGMYNVKADAFTTRAMNWSTQAAATKLHNSDSQTEGTSNRHHVNVVKGSGSTIKFNFPCINDKTKWLGDGGQGSTKAVFTDNKSQNYEFNYSVVSAKTHVYTLKVATATSEDNAYLDVWQPYGGQLTYAEGQGFTEWAFIRFSDIENGNYATYKAKKALYEIYQAVVAAGHENTYQEDLRTAFMTYIRTDVTAADVKAATNVLINAVSPALTAGYVNAGALFTNPDMRGAGTKADWTSGYTNPSWGVLESYHNGNNKLTQTKTVPNGFYKVVFHGIWRQDGSNAAPTLTLRSGDNSVSANVPCMTDIDFGVGNTNNNDWTNKNGKIIPNGMQSAGEGLSHGSAQVTISDFVVSDGQLTIEMNSSSTSQWILAQGFDIYFKAESMEEYANLFYDAKSAAEAIDQNTLNTYAKNTLTTALNNAATEQIDKAWYQEHTAALNNAVTIANDIATTYPKTSALLTICNDILDNSIEFEDGAAETFSTAVGSAKTNVELATTADAINNNYNILEAARQTYVQQADPTNGTVFDYTFKVTNPEFNNGTTGWTSNTSAYSNTIATNQGGAITGNYYENWNESSYVGAISQTIKGLPTGKYELTAAAFRDQLIKDADADAVYVFANDGKTLVNSATPEFYSVMASSGDGNLKIGIKSEDKVYKWMGIDNVSLKYHGFDAEVAQTGLNNLIAEAQALVGKPMNAKVATALADAIANADATKTTRNELNSMIEVLSKAITDAEASIAAYEAINRYIIKANTIDVSIAASYKSNYDNRTLSDPADKVFEALELATYDYIKHEFSYPVELEANGWIPEGPTAPMSGQHFDGTDSSSYLEQSAAAWGWDAWSISYKHDKTLPAGDYVFKVAGRRASGTGNTMSLVVTNINDPDNVVELGLVNDFPEGDTGLGINTKGETSFDANDEAGFANNGAGRGWQWRYVKFTLSSETKVRIAVNAEATTNHQWVGFCNATLQMTEETYLAANMSALDAPTAAANALVDTKPMGTAANQALKDALNMSVNTGAELLAKIEALNKAVANANAWVVEYNNAKVQLVEALERFEADYNKDGVKMSQTVWDNVLDKVQAAAVAKDVTDRYDGFADAKKDLTDALAEADESIEAYAALKTAIDAANTAANGANIGDAPFQRPVSAQTALNEAIATAQAAYDKAEADATEVKNTLATAVEAFNNAELNKPKADEAFNIVLVYAGWDYNGKAMTYIANDREDHGLYNIKYKAEPNANYAQAFTFTAVEGKVNHYTLSMTDVDGNERYVCTGVAYGGNTSQIRTTTEADKALAVKVIATSTDGIWNLYNTEANNYIGSQDEGVFTVNSHINFNLRAAEKANVTLALSEVGWATLILPFDAELPEGVKAYSCEKADKNAEEDQLTLVPVEDGIIKANTPYLMNGQENTYTFSGYGLADKDSYTVGLFTGTYTNYQTENDGETYVLQNQNGEVAFYRVGESKQPTVKPYRCYMTYEGAVAAPAMFSLGRGEGTTSIDKAQLTIDNVVIYDLMGRRVTTMEKGSMYIVNGKKVVVK